jgi:hypothetical protein
MITRENLTKIKHDVNGNPRYVVHFLQVLPNNRSNNISLDKLYAMAIKNSRVFGGKKYHNKSYGV